MYLIKILYFGFLYELIYCIILINIINNIIYYKQIMIMNNMLYYIIYYKF